MTYHDIVDTDAFRAGAALVNPLGLAVFWDAPVPLHEVRDEDQVADLVAAMRTRDLWRAADGVGL